MESAYYRGLEAPAKRRYREKLSFVGLSIQDDPFLEGNKPRFNDNMANWPRIEYGHIFAYFISKPGIYTQEQLVSWKQLDAYNYFQAGYVRNIISFGFHHLGKRLVMLKAKVNPSQRSPDEASEAWLIAKHEGDIICAHCTCIAGLGEGCSHTAAVMFKIECAVRLGYTSTTSQPCSWNDTFCRKIEPSRIVDIHFSKPKRGKDLPCMANELPRKKQKIVPVCDEEEDAFFAGLRKVMPSSTILSSVTVAEQSAPRSSVVRKLPALLKSLQKASYAAMSEDELEEVCHDVFSTQLKITSEESAYLEESTRLQSLSPLWHQHREGRITSSLFKRVKNASIVNPPMSLVKTVMGEYKFDSTKVPALNWRITHEDIARKEYIALVSEDHVELECVESGLHVNPLFPHLGATPDGVVNCDCCGKGLLEIKCPYKHRNSHPHRIEDSAFFLVKGDNGEIHLSTEHEYYFQIQGQLAVCDLHYCDFVCWTLCGLHHERVLADHDHFEEVKPALDRFFVSVLLPRLLTGSMSGSTGVEQAAQAHIPDTYCWCNGKDEGKMVACDNDSCERQWFHFGCVGVSRKPRGKWFCSADCRRKEMLLNASY